jgi:hypothetical protein
MQNDLARKILLDQNIFIKLAKSIATKILNPERQSAECGL